MDFSPFLAAENTAAYVSSLTLIDALMNIDSKTFLINSFGGSVPQPAP